MKTIKILLCTLATYIASHCYRKLISSEEVTEDVITDLLRNPEMDSIALVDFHYSFTKKSESRTSFLLTTATKEKELAWIMRHIKICREHPEWYTMKLSMKKYSLSQELILCILEWIWLTENFEYRYIHQYQWVELKPKDKEKN